MATNKTRNLSVAEYFVAIQKEYLIAEFRKKIYFNPNDKTYYQRVMNYKFEKINDIAKRNRLDSILNNSITLDEIKSELFDKLGKPKFEMNETDLENYYSNGNDFSFRGEIWVLDQINEDESLTLYSVKHQRFENANKNEVCRIL
jgi:hypothetical protein